MSEAGGSSREPENQNKSIPPIWNGSQRGILIGLLLILAAYISIRCAFNRRYVPDPQPDVPPRPSDLADKIDPNTADLATLAALPTIGEKRAKDIIAYRERIHRERPHDVPFERLEDLLKIHGIGAATIQTLKPYLIFPPAHRPTTNP
jgi:hypothetical protein